MAQTEKGKGNVDLQVLRHFEAGAGPEHPEGVRRLL